MTVGELIARLKRLNPDAQVVRYADMCGLDECDAVLKIELIRRRPQSEASNGTGKYVDAATKPRSRAKRLPGVAIL